jgi:hypothetical protein
MLAALPLFNYMEYEVVDAFGVADFDEERCGRYRGVCTFYLV